MLDFFALCAVPRAGKRNALLSTVVCRGRARVSFRFRFVVVLWCLVLFAQLTGFLCGTTSFSGVQMSLFKVMHIGDITIHFSSSFQHATPDEMLQLESAFAEFPVVLGKAIAGLEGKRRATSRAILC